jgi:hypothetical protein
MYYFTMIMIASLNLDIGHSMKFLRLAYQNRNNFLINLRRIL